MTVGFIKAFNKCILILGIERIKEALPKILKKWEEKIGVQVNGFL